MFKLKRPRSPQSESSDEIGSPLSKQPHIENSTLTRQQMIQIIWEQDRVSFDEKNSLNDRAFSAILKGPREENEKIYLYQIAYLLDWSYQELLRKTKEEINAALKDLEIIGLDYDSPIFTPGALLYSRLPLRLFHHFCQTAQTQVELLYLLGRPCTNKTQVELNQCFKLLEEMLGLSFETLREASEAEVKLKCLNKNLSYDKTVFPDDLFPKEKEAISERAADEKIHERMLEWIWKNSSSCPPDFTTTGSFATHLHRISISRKQKHTYYIYFNQILYRLGFELTTSFLSHKHRKAEIIKARFNDLAIPQFQYDQPIIIPYKLEYENLPFLLFHHFCKTTSSDTAVYHLLGRTVWGNHVEKMQKFLSKLEEKLGVSPITIKMLRQTPVEVARAWCTQKGLQYEACLFSDRNHLLPLDSVQSSKTKKEGSALLMHSRQGQTFAGQFSAEPPTDLSETRVNGISNSKKRMKRN
jgi:hypothetical protein